MGYMGKTSEDKNKISKAELQGKMYYIATVTLEWCEVVPLQLHRYQQYNNIFPLNSSLRNMESADRLLLIIAVNNAIHYLDFLKEQLKVLENAKYDDKIPILANKDEKEKIRVLRNSNIHLDNYITNTGKDQEKFVSEFVTTDGYKCVADNSSTIIIGSEIRFGDVNISDFCYRIKMQLPIIRNVISEIQEEYRGEL